MDVQNLPPDPQFSVLRIVHRRGTYTVAWLEFGRQRDHVLGERWDGESATDVGYPVGRGGRPKWMVIADHLVKGRLKDLLGEPGSNDEALLWALRDFEARKDRVRDRLGNNAVVICPACGEPFLVSAMLNGPLGRGSRECPHCRGAMAFATHSEEHGVSALVELREAQPA